jgi:acyl carrier protein phosphodiesterase
MNHLAHALLAGDEDLLIVGSLMGDFVHGRITQDMQPRLASGIRLHRAVDVFTDTHAEVGALRALFAPPFRRYAGILLDLWFDHLLARDFACWSTQPLEAFSARVQSLLRQHAAELPAEMRAFAAYMESNGLPAGYADSARIGRALIGVGRRLSRANPLHEALPLLQEKSAEIQHGFARFFPQLVEYAREWRAAS